MVSKLKSKREIRHEMEQAIDQYLNKGGKINRVDRGISGYDINQNPSQNTPLNSGAQQTRTLLTETVKRIDQRKQNKKANEP